MKNFFRSTFGIVMAVVAFFAVVSFFSVRSTEKLIVTQAEESVRNLVKVARSKIDRLMSDVETAVASQVWIIGENLSDPDYMYRITRELVGNHPFVCGSTVAFRSGFYPSKGHFWAPYTYRNEKGELESIQLGTSSNDYFKQEWYCCPLKNNAPTWSEPYFDIGGGKVWMSTYSMPIRTSSTNVCAIFTADLSLEQLMDFVSKIRPYENSYVIMKAGDKVLVGEEEEAKKLSGAYVGKVLSNVERADNGWTVEIGCPIEEIMRAPNRIVNRIIVFSAVGLCLIVGLSLFYASRLQKSTALRERMAGELGAAKSIQSCFLPTSFPAGLFATVRPAREVGGDLYDFFSRGDELYFIVGDASGKGVPAALFSFMAVTSFRMACSLGLDPGEICGRINELLTKNNEMCMFVTVFVGALNRRTGELRYGCAGHNPPVVVALDGTASFLSVKRAPPTGAVAGVFYSLQTAQLGKGSKLVAYTDGITEAERTNHEQYGERRLLDLVAVRAAQAAEPLARSLLASVDDFAAGAEQFDDMTVLVLEV